jgi:hypothetical protein
MHFLSVMCHFVIVMRHIVLDTHHGVAVINSGYASDKHLSPLRGLAITPAGVKAESRTYVLGCSHGRDLAQENHATVEL